MRPVCTDKIELRIGSQTLTILAGLAAALFLFVGPDTTASQDPEGRESET